jgi:hypothetical protein
MLLDGVVEPKARGLPADGGTTSPHPMATHFFLSTPSLGSSKSYYYGDGPEFAFEPPAHSKHDSPAGTLLVCHQGRSQ